MTDLHWGCYTPPLMALIVIMAPIVSGSQITQGAAKDNTIPIRDGQRTNDDGVVCGIIYK